MFAGRTNLLSFQDRLFLAVQTCAHSSFQNVCRLNTTKRECLGHRSCLECQEPRQWKQAATLNECLYAEATRERARILMKPSTRVSFRSCMSSQLIPGSVKLTELEEVWERAELPRDPRPQRQEVIFCWPRAPCWGQLWSFLGAA